MNIINVAKYIHIEYRLYLTYIFSTFGSSKICSFYFDLSYSGFLILTINGLVGDNFYTGLKSYVFIRVPFFISYLAISKFYCLFLSNSSK